MDEQKIYDILLEINGDVGKIKGCLQPLAKTVSDHGEAIVSLRGRQNWFMGVGTTLVAGVGLFFTYLVNVLHNGGN